MIINLEVLLQDSLGTNKGCFVLSFIVIYINNLNINLRLFQKIFLNNRDE